MQIFFNSVHTQYYMKHSWLNPWMWNLGSRGPAVKLYVEFLFHKILTPLSLAIVQDSTILSSPTAMTCGFPGGASGKEPACQCRDAGSSPGSGRSLEEGMATYSSILAWRIPLTEEPGGLQSMGLQKVGHAEVTAQHSYNLLKKLDLNSTSINILESPLIQKKFGSLLLHQSSKCEGLQNKQFTNKTPFHVTS